MRRYLALLLLAGAGLAIAATSTRAEIHNGGVDCTNWNGTYRLAGTYSRAAGLAPPHGDTIVVRQSSCSGLQLEATVAGERCTIDARMNGSRRSMSVHGQYCAVWGSWVDGYGKNWIITLTPDPLRPHVPHSVREYLLTSFHTILVQDSIQNPNDLVPLATFGEGGPREGKMREHVDSRSAYLLPVEPEPAVEKNSEHPARDRAE